MLMTQRDRIDCEIVRPISTHGRCKPDRRLAIALIQSAMVELPVNSLRRQVLEQMIARWQD
jgi:hypothetical protein